jgi:hypothetical protein
MFTNWILEEDGMEKDGRWLGLLIFRRNKHKTDITFRNIHAYVDYLISKIFGIDMNLKK